MSHILDILQAISISKGNMSDKKSALNMQLHDIFNIWGLN